LGFLLPPAALGRADDTALFGRSLDDSGYSECVCTRVGLLVSRHLVDLMALLECFLGSFGSRNRLSHAGVVGCPPQPQDRRRSYVYIHTSALPTSSEMHMHDSYSDLTSSDQNTRAGCLLHSVLSHDPTTLLFEVSQLLASKLFQSLLSEFFKHRLCPFVVLQRSTAISIHEPVQRGPKIGGLVPGIGSSVVGCKFLGRELDWTFDAGVEFVPVARFS
jgi:hypothetical protein